MSVQEPKFSADTIIDRISSPLSASFFVSWCICNWNLVLHFFDSSVKASVRVKNISTNINAIDGLFAPLIFAFVYVALMPRALKLYREFTENLAHEAKKSDFHRKIKLEAYEKFEVTTKIKLPTALIHYQEEWNESVKELRKNISGIAGQLHHPDNLKVAAMLETVNNFAGEYFKYNPELKEVENLIGKHRVDPGIRPHNFIKKYLDEIRDAAGKID